jgi:predicted transcriptional regulator
MSTQTVLGIPQPTISGATFSATTGFGSFDLLLHHRRRREVRSQDVILLAILEACRTPTVQHWIMVKARLGYDTFRKHMNQLVSLGMMNTLTEGNKTLYSLSERGLSLLQQMSPTE